MNIGIDIDGTITDINKQLDDELINYLKSINKLANNQNAIIDRNDGQNIKIKYNLTDSELKYFLGPIQENITDNAKPRINAVKTINKLKEQGMKIIIITARDSEFHLDPYNQSKHWLDQHNIIYDKLIVNARDKAKICLEEKITYLIDDSEYNWQSVNNIGIKTIKIIPSKNIPKENEYNNWDDIYSYITNN